MTEFPHKPRFPTGEIIAFAALVVSALGVWIAWESSKNDKPTRVVEQHQAIPLTLRANREDDGTRLNISPVESSHALEGLTITLPGASPISVGSDGELSASDVEAALKGRETEPKNQTLSVQARVSANYVEMGKDRKSSGTYKLRYQWKSGGLFSGRSLHLVSLSR
jgi:hypothetical protein